MNIKSIINSLNMTEGDVLTLEKAKDRIEFEALPIMSGLDAGDNNKCRLYEDWECPSLEGN
ncbi:MAG TPA: hypothetical protein DDW67_09915 [Elusimicrobia bacterium]|nr:hypothetical protein [Elusimicrobiota bacterium]